MQSKRIIGAVTAVVALTAAGILYAVHPAKSSDHQDTYNLANSVGHNTSADITDVFVFQSPSNPANVVFAMDVSPLIPAGMGGSYYFDPTLLWQFKISHQTSGQEDEVIQLRATGTGVGQTITLYGPNAPAQVGTTNTVIGQTGSFGNRNVGDGQLHRRHQSVRGAARGPVRVRPFRVLLVSRRSQRLDAFEPKATQARANPVRSITAIRWARRVRCRRHTTKAAARATAPSFNGFPTGTLSSTGSTAYACSTNPAQNVLSSFNVLTYVVEVPKTYLTTAQYNSAASTSPNIHVWATVSSNTTNS